MTMRLIDAEEAFEMADEFLAFEEGLADKTDLKDLLNICDTIEAKPVVHCKDCKYNVANRQQDPLDITDYTDIVCDYFMTDGMEADDFCSKGVKIPVISMEDVPKIMEEMEK